ncbi:MAG: hypothetical protein B7Z47_05565, partial [Chthoniobacter sp. 12-60-6]
MHLWGHIRGCRRGCPGSTHGKVGRPHGTRQTSRGHDFRWTQCRRHRRPAQRRRDRTGVLHAT